MSEEFWIRIRKPGLRTTQPTAALYSEYDQDQSPHLDPDSDQAWGQKVCLRVLG